MTLVIGPEQHKLEIPFRGLVFPLGSHVQTHSSVNLAAGYISARFMLKTTYTKTATAVKTSAAQSLSSPSSLQTLPCPLLQVCVCVCALQTPLAECWSMADWDSEWASMGEPELQRLPADLEVDVM